jgi:hypothetical protein
MQQAYCRDVKGFPCSPPVFIVQFFNDSQRSESSQYNNRRGKRGCFRDRAIFTNSH